MDFAAAFLAAGDPEPDRDNKDSSGHKSQLVSPAIDCGPSQQGATKRTQDAADKKRTLSQGDATERKKIRRGKRYDLANAKSLGQSSLFIDENTSDEDEAEELDDAERVAEAHLISNRSKAIDEIFEKAKEVDITKTEVNVACQSFARQQAIKFLKTDGPPLCSMKGVVSAIRLYQMMGIAWMRCQEKSKSGARGGIVAYDVGLGKTLMMQVNVFDSLRERRLEGIGFGKKQRTLIVVPGTLVNHWLKEFKKHFGEEFGSILCYHGAAKDVCSTPLAEFKKRRIVITTYEELSNSHPKIKPPTTTDDPEGRAKLAEFEKHFKQRCGPLHLMEWDRLIIDEAQNLKNHLTIKFRAARALKCKFVWLGTGTLLQNSAKELYSYFALLRIQHTATMKEFTHTYFKGGKPLELLSTTLSQNMIRMTQDSKLLGEKVLRLPKKSVRDRYVEFSDIEQEIYKKKEIEVERAIEAIKKAKAERGMMHEEESEDSSKNAESEHVKIMKLVMGLRQLCSHHLMLGRELPDLVEDSKLDVLLEDSIGDSAVSSEHVKSIRRWLLHASKAYKEVKSLCGVPDLKKKKKLTKKLKKLRKDCELRVGEWAAKEISLPTSAKTRATVSQVREWMGENPNKKIIIFTQFIATADYLKIACTKAGFKSECLHGKVAHKAKFQAIENWESAPDVPILIMTLRTGGTGLNLVAGCRVIIVDLWWNKAVEQQAFGRVCRIGQLEETELVRIVVLRTIDERILDIQQKKAAEIEGLLKGNKKIRLTIDDLAYLAGSKLDDKEKDDQKIIEDDSEGHCDFDDSSSSGDESSDETENSDEDTESSGWEIE